MKINNSIVLKFICALIFIFFFIPFYFPAQAKNKKIAAAKHKKRRKSKLAWWLANIDHVPHMWLEPNSSCKAPRHFEEKKLVIIIASYNNKFWYKYNLDSVFAQRYKNYRVIYLDDCSTDGTGDLVKEYLDGKKEKNRVLLICNTERRGKTANLYKAIHMCSDDEIVVVLDGDDWFAHRDALSYLNYLYSSNDIWMTYGGLMAFPSKKKSYCVSVPQECVKERNFRNLRSILSQQRSFYASLYKHIKLEDLFYKGKFFSAASDAAKMYPMFEMAGERFRFITEVVYIYNVINPLNDFKVNRSLQKEIHEFILQKPKYPLLTDKNMPLNIDKKADLILITYEKRFSENLSSEVKKRLHGINAVHAIILPKEISLSDKIYVKKFILGHMQSLIKKNSLADYALILFDMKLPDRTIDIKKSVSLLERTFAEGLFLSISEQFFISPEKKFCYEEIEDDICAWQFGYGPLLGQSIDKILTRKETLISMLDSSDTSINTFFAKEKVGLFFRH